MTIFISYRRQDTKAIAGRIFDRLALEFGRDGVFMDIDTIPFGVDFHAFLDAEVSRASIVLALIGHGWADAADELGRRRLDDPDDFVRIEIEAALRRNIPLGAVLIDGVAMPRAEHLPESLRPFVRRNAAFVDAGRDFHPHMNRLIAGLRQHLAVGPGVVGAGGGRDEARRIKPGSGESFQDFAEGPEMVVVPAGEFMMGSPDGEGGADDRPQHRVFIPKPFAIGRYPVTFADWDACVAAGGVSHEPKAAWGRGNQPVMNVSWEDARRYIEWLRKVTGKDYRLPSEAEWEYAARAGTRTRYTFGDSGAGLNDYGWSKVNSGGKTHPVGEKKPNPWGLYDVHGNVWEWCEDEWRDSYAGKPDALKANGGAWTTGGGGLRVLRGGSWGNDPPFLRAAFRFRFIPGLRFLIVGFRLSRTLNP